MYDAEVLADNIDDHLGQLIVVTISSEPMFTGPVKSDSTKWRTPSRHSSISSLFD